MINLPTVEELQRLPLRAIAAYAARAARRVRPVVSGVIEDDIIEEALSVIENVAPAERLDLLDAASACLAASRVGGAADALTTSTQQLAAIGIMSAAGTAYAVLQGAMEPKRRGYYAGHAARGADRAARTCDVLEETTARAAVEAARRDYEVLLKRSGGDEDVTVGDPIDLSEASMLGRLM